ncbi:MAG: phosphoribosylaminoimidazolesuccinocarboxamide synthase [Arcobacter sp.]|jgi:phosphoribosylaminoimidazole-succinocarboxamide synthase|uniref:phosphoribosylaminoimidazolesuccinocarboxamide synthase n=1 Tax=Arcobacter defluvii TaxID=873191 RepID=A0AAE7BIL3_9BACT|nr:MULTISPECIES: phosphoribosylaminoimidazolesuccinocarboxamide synthase [Arcobacter]MDY3199449.1 phosphoribosylaminoimidazolesuccinocarboxamide synthase [Arcobacter sp.]QKF78717.1 phosphoribosylaminoimidazole-succinocarboxamide synthase [Arcobacter defluvii]RXI33972.1 phosphoribosylaminoimidazolesuccinocarboxamide synthase [Arcobacter defluvii]BAK74494.1 phosphoribosylaminoimidazole-succinocarboxamide synthase [Arcobacter sp. L]
MKISEIIALGLWPESKKITSQKGIEELEQLGYNLFYIGKNADLYTCPGDDAKVLLVRSDRCSVFDIPLNLEIEGKGVSQTAISNNGAKFAKKLGVRTAILDETVDQNLSVAPRCQLMELCKALEAQIDGEVVQFELIFRNYLTGSLFEATQKGQDPYGLNLSSDLKEWSKFETPLFTPTTKGVKDIPLNSQKVRDTFPEIISSLEKLFSEFTKFAQDNGIIVVDTKLEVFVNSKGEWILGDEILTPESSRFISKEDFEKQNYISMDKQILRDFGKASNWKEQAKELKPGQKLDVIVPQEIKDKILSGYTTILKRLS